MKKLTGLISLFILSICIFFSSDVSAAENTGTIQVYVGQELSIDSLLGVEPGTYDGYTFRSSKKTVASVRDGILNAKKKGTTLLTIKKKGETSLKVTLSAVKPWIKVHMLDIGQGDSFLIQTVNSNILIDTGEYKEYSNLKKQLKQFGADQLDALVVTHFDTDHYGSAQSVIRDYLKDDGVFIHPLHAAENNRTYQNLQKFLLKNPVREKVLSVRDEGKIINELGLDGMEFMLLSADEGEDTNDSSLVFRMSFFGSSWLFTGDASASVLNRAMATYPEQIKADVLKVSHHGSDYSNPLLFIYRTGARISLIGVGAGNEYGHPAATTLSRLEKYTESIYRTDTDGTVTVAWKNGKYSVSTEQLIKRETVAGKEEVKIDPGTKGVVPEETPDQIIGNVKSHVYHMPTCGSLPIEKNRKYFGSMADAEAEGYHACGSCVK